MDRRRALLAGGGFPENYLFKEGYGFREDLIQTYYSGNGAGKEITKERIYLYGGKSGYTEVLMINHGISIKSDGTFSSYTDLDLSQYTKLCIEATDTCNVSRPASMGIYDHYSKCTLEKISKDGTNDYTANYTSTRLEIYGHSSRTIHTLDISSISTGTIIIRSGDFSACGINVYNIWLE